MASKTINKALGFSLKVDGVSRLRKMSKKHWSWSILEHPGKFIKYLIKPVVYGGVRCHFRKIGSQKYQESIRFHWKLMPFDVLAKHRKPLVKQRFEASGKVDKIPYKTCRLWSLLGPFLRFGLQKYQKRIRFSTKSWWRFTTSQNIKKPLVKQCFGASAEVEQHTL